MSAQPYAGLLELLNRRGEIVSTGHPERFGGRYTNMPLINPDGPEAAEAISSLLNALRPFAIIAECRDIPPFNERPDNVAAFSGLAAPTEGDFRRARKVFDAALNSEGEGL